MKKRNKLKGIVKWILSALGASVISLAVWKLWASLSLLHRKTYQLTSIKISIGYLIVILVVFCLIALLFWFFSKFTERRKESWSGVAVIPRYGYQEVGTGIYRSVKWLLLLPNPGPFDSHPLLPSPSPSEIAKRLELKGPFCPKCDTELEENKKLFRYTWTCVKCGFRIRSKIQIYKLREKAYLCFQSDIREHLRKQMKKEV